MRSNVFQIAGEPEAAMRKAESGLTWSEAESVANALGLPLEGFADLARIARSTYYRRRGKRFTAAESERILRYARLWSLARDVIPTDKGARTWLGRSQYGLDGAIPLEFAKSEFGARVVEDLLVRIDHNVLS